MCVCWGGAVGSWKKKGSGAGELVTNLSPKIYRKYSEVLSTL